MKKMLTGRTVLRSVVSGTTSSLSLDAVPHGVYILRTGGTVHRVIKR